MNAVMAELADALDSGSSEQYVHMGSSPFNRTKFWGLGSVGRAMRSQCIGQGFESPSLHQILKNPTV